MHTDLSGNFTSLKYIQVTWASKYSWFVHVEGHSAQNSMHVT